jgi:PAS domain S-box-containing protein
MNDFMRAVFNDRQRRGFNLDIDVYDGTQVSAQTLLYNHNNDDLDYTKSAFVRVKYIKMGGRFWSIYIHSHSTFESEINLNRSYLTAFIGFAMTEMLTIITWLLVNGRQRAVKLAKKMNGELLERETRYRQMFEGSCNMAVLIAPETGNIVDANPAASDFWGYSVEKLRTMNISDIHTLPLDKVLPILNVALKQNLHLETQHRLSNGDIKDIEFYSNAIVYEGKMVLYAILHDITERKQQEEEIKRLSESELNKAKLEAEKANRAKSEFLSQMSHELRTPMNAVLGFAQLLALDELTEDQSESVEHIITAGHHLMDLINQVLDLARIEAEKLELNFEEISLTFLIQNCLSLVQPLTMKNQIQLIDNSGIGFQSLVIVDKLRFKQVLLNLISNAIKYNRTAGSVTITTALVKPHRLKISITDTGNGLSKAQLAKLFQPFERLTAKNSQIEGTGIGLCISKKLIEAMDGRIGVESEEGEGSCFWIEIPCL